jgi:hypothetical protein
LLCLLPALMRAETVAQAWVQTYNGPANGSDLATAVAVDTSNNVIVTGVSSAARDVYDPDYVTIKYPAPGVVLWTNRYNGPGNGFDYAQAIAVDGGNNVIVAGVSDVGGFNYDYATIKYSSAGVPLWTNYYDGPAHSEEYLRALAVDGSNNVIVTGNSPGITSGHDYATIKYSSAGVPLWTNRYNNWSGYLNNDLALAVAVDGSNDVIVAGIATQGSYLADYLTIKYSSAGVPLWTNRYNGPDGREDEPTAVAVDGRNDVIVTGRSTGSGLSFDYATIKYSSSGVPLWTNRYDGAGEGGDYATAVAVDGSRNVIVTGYSYSNNYADSEFVTIQYSNEGVPLWTNRYNGPVNGSERAYSVAVDPSGNVIVTGYSPGSGSGEDYATIKYSGEGVPLWTNRYNGLGNGSDQAYGVAVDHTGNVVVTGWSTGAGGDDDFATVKYVSVAWPPALTALGGTGGTFQLLVDDVLQPGTLVIEASTDLAAWAPVFTNTTPTNVLFYSDPEAGNHSWRFYRAFQFP